MRKTIARILVLGMATFGLVAATSAFAPQAEARPAVPWDPGYIISDAEFYNGSAMTAAEIQSFLNSKVPTCRTGYTCLKSYRENTPTIAASAFCKGYQGAQNETAAQMIAKVAQSCNINPKVLLVTLEKEMSLVTHDWPSQWRYDKALGYACPDTAPCNPQFGVFIYQMYYGAQQFQRYTAYPTGYNYQAGRNNNILFHPRGQSACGSSQVYIQNQATANLYNYTPYQPNSAALANMTGEGDSCSSYGNRNFWYLYWAWFGSPITSSSLVKSPTSATIYLLSGELRYSIGSWDRYLQLSSKLGEYQVVSADYIASYSNGGAVGDLYRSASGTVSLMVDGRLMSFPSCAVAEDYGFANCAAGYVQLTADQYSKFQHIGTLRNTVNSADGSLYSIKQGVVTEYLTTQLRTNAGFTDSPLTVPSSLFTRYEYAAPVIGSGTVLVTTRSSTTTTLLIDNEAITGVPTAIVNKINPNMAKGLLHSSSVGKLPHAKSQFTPVMLDSQGNAVWIEADGVTTIPAALLRSGLSLHTAPPTLTSALPSLGIIGDVEQFVTGPTGGAVRMPTDQGMRAFSSWDALISVANSPSPTIKTVPQELLSSVITGPPIVPVGALVRTSTNPGIFYISGLDTRSFVSSFELTDAAGVKGWFTVSPETMRGYEVQDRFALGFSCGTDRYVSSGGQVRKIPASDYDLYPIDLLALDSKACATLKVGAEAVPLIRVMPGSTLYALEDGFKRPIRSWDLWLEISNGRTWMDVPSQWGAAIPTGTPMSSSESQDQS